MGIINYLKDRQAEKEIIKQEKEELYKLSDIKFMKSVDRGCLNEVVVDAFIINKDKNRVKNICDNKIYDCEFTIKSGFSAAEDVRDLKKFMSDRYGFNIEDIDRISTSDLQFNEFVCDYFGKLAYVPEYDIDRTPVSLAFIKDLVINLKEDFQKEHDLNVISEESKEF